MVTETIKPGYAFKEDVATANYADNRVELRGATTTLKIVNDSAGVLEFALNRSEDTDEVDGTVKAGETLNLADIDQGLSSVAVRGAGLAYRFWAYY